ncbi:MAG: hypothetical protein WCS42_10085 [Verrucomicrobiota bacterium]
MKSSFRSLTEKMHMKRKPASLTVILLAMSVLGVCAQNTVAPAGYWRFEKEAAEGGAVTNGQAATVLLDSSINHNNGVAESGARPCATSRTWRWPSCGAMV